MGFFTFFKKWFILGKKGGHKGRMRTYTSPEEIDAQMKEEKERKKVSCSEDSDDEGSQVIVIFVIFGTKCIFNASINSNGPSDVTCLEEIEKQKAKERYMKMHLAGKTDQAKADLARLAIIRKQREEAARKKEEERIFQSILT
uniref:Pdgfa associated protein 1b n=1 Tax=Cyprinus carpio TaxID=7962 RepID=A0A8C1ICH0_CYPCA